MEEIENLRHQEKMKKKKAVRDKIAADKQQEKGLLIVHTGKGKGKTSAAFGMVFRALGHNMRVGIVQFGKGSRISGERQALDKFRDQVTIFAEGEGFTWETQDRTKDIDLARYAWQKAQEMLANPEIDMVLCDELNIILRYEYLDLDEILAHLAKRPASQHVIVTGRNAHPRLIETADLVTEMTLIKHPYKSGIKGQKGIEF